MGWDEDQIDQTSKTKLHPWRVILGVISDLNNSDIVVDVINRSGLQVSGDRLATRTQRGAVTTFR